MKRVDLLLLDKNLVRSRSEAQKLIAAGLVEVRQAQQWRVVCKASEKFNADSEFKTGFLEEQKYVSRAGLKLEAALDTLESLGVSLQGMLALDIGQSTGGFTDCLLQRGVSHVVGLEVGSGQLSSALAGDPRVTTLEHYNARKLQLTDLLPVSQNGFDIIVMDVSFISQHLILPSLPQTMPCGAWIITLIKPQFEAGKAFIGKNGIVSSPEVYERVKNEICTHLAELGLHLHSYTESVIKGGDGNREFIAVAQKK